LGASLFFNKKIIINSNFWNFLLLGAIGNGLSGLVQWSVLIYVANIIGSTKTYMFSILYTIDFVIACSKNIVEINLW